MGDLPSWSRIRVPKPLNEAFPLEPDWKGEFTYARIFMRPPLSSRETLILRSGNVHPLPEVILNGKTLRPSRPAALSLQVDLRAALNEGENLLLLRFRFEPNPAIPRPDRPVPLGIWGPAWLEVRPRRPNISAVRVSASERGRWTGRVEFEGTPGVAREVRLTLFDPSGHAIFRKSVTLEKGQREIEVSGRVKDPLAWSFEYPTLYRLEAVLTGKSSDRRVVGFGFRKLRLTPDGFELNGKPFFLRAVRDDFVFPGWGRAAPSSGVLMRRLAAAKEIGFNVVVCTGWPPDSRAAYFAERLGLLLWYELPGSDSFEEETGATLEKLLEEILERDGNSPSAAVVSLFGERIPEPRERAREWARNVLSRREKGGVLLLPGPSPELEPLSRCRFVPPGGEDRGGGKPRVAWKIVPPWLPDLKGRRYRAIRGVGGAREVVSDLEAVQSERVSDAVAEIRGRDLAHGYVFHRLCDAPGDERGLLSAEGEKKETARRLLQGDVWVGPVERPPAAVSREKVSFKVVVSHFSDLPLDSGRLRCSGPGLREEFQIPRNDRYVRVGEISFSAPRTATPREERVDFVLESGSRHLWAENSIRFSVLPGETAVNRTLYLEEKLRAEDSFFRRIVRRGYGVTNEPGGAGVNVWRSLTYEVSERLKKGGCGLFLLEGPEDLPENAGLAVLPADDSEETFLYLRSESPLFAGLSRRSIAGRAFDSVRRAPFLEGIDESDSQDVLAALLCSSGIPFRPVAAAFRLGRGWGLLMTLPLRKGIEEDDPVAVRIFDAAVASLAPGVLPRPRFVPDLANEVVLVPVSRAGSTLWRVAWKAPRTTWYLKDFDDRTWRRCRGAFGRRGAPSLVLRTTWETPDIYLRTEFSVRRIPRRLKLLLFHDRDVEVVINGKTVLRRKGYTTDFVEVELPFDPGTLLVAGVNVLAVHCRQDRMSHNLDVGLVAGY